MGKGNITYFTVKNIDLIMDGRMIVVETTKDKFFIPRDTMKVHLGKSPNENNRITDPELIDYLIYKIEIFIYRREEQNKFYKLVIGDLKKL